MRFGYSYEYHDVQGVLYPRTLWPGWTIQYDSPIMIESRGQKYYRVYVCTSPGWWCDVDPPSVARFLVNE